MGRTSHEARLRPRRGAEARLAREWRLRAGLRYDAVDARTNAGTLHVQYRHDPKRVLNAAYRLVRDIDPDQTIRQADLSFVWPIASRWRAIGRWSVALDEAQSRTLETFGGLAYESCCLTLRLVARRYLSHAHWSASDERYSNSLYLQVELKGLTGTGVRPKDFLIRGIPGYENEF